MIHHPFSIDANVNFDDTIDKGLGDLNPVIWETRVGKSFSGKKIGWISRKVIGFPIMLLVMRFPWISNHVAFYRPLHYMKVAMGKWTFLGENNVPR